MLINLLDAQSHAAIEHVKRVWAPVVSQLHGDFNHRTREL